MLFTVRAVKFRFLFWFTESHSDFTILQEASSGGLDPPSFEYFQTTWSVPDSYWLLSECVLTIQTRCLEEWSDVISYFQTLTRDHEVWLMRNKDDEQVSGVARPGLVSQNVCCVMSRKRVALWWQLGRHMFHGSGGGGVSSSPFSTVGYVLQTK